MTDQLENQNRVLEKMSKALEDVARSVVQLETKCQSLAEQNSKLVSSVQSGSETLKRLEDSIKQMPRVADAQRETLVTVSKQLESMREVGEATIAAVGSLEQRSTDQTTAIQTAVSAINSSWERTDAHQKDMTAAQDLQTRRITWFGASAVTLAGAALVVALIALIV